MCVGTTVNGSGGKTPRAVRTVDLDPATLDVLAAGRRGQRDALGHEPVGLFIKPGGSLLNPDRLAGLDRVVGRTRDRVRSGKWPGPFGHPAQAGAVDPLVPWSPERVDTPGGLRAGAPLPGTFPPCPRPRAPAPVRGVNPLVDRARGRRPRETVPRCVSLVSPPGHNACHVG